MGKGGHRNLRKPDLDDEHLLDILLGQVKKHGVSNCFEFEPYGEHLVRTSACNAAGLVKAHHFVIALAQAAPSLTVKYGQLKECLSTVSRKYKELLEMVPEHKKSGWPGDTAEKIMVVLTHTRLADQQKFRECCSKATEWQCQHLEKLRELALAAKSDDNVAPPVANPKVMTPQKKKRQDDGLDLEIPETPSLDSLGKEFLADEADQASPIPSSKHKIKDILGLKKKPASKKAKSTAGSPLKRPAAKISNPATTSKLEITEKERKSLHLMPYKTGACAIRVKKGRQLLQVKASSPEKSKEMAKRLLKMLEKKVTLKAALELKAEWLKK